MRSSLHCQSGLRPINDKEKQLSTCNTRLNDQSPLYFLLPAICLYVSVSLGQTPFHLVNTPPPPPHCGRGSLASLGVCMGLASKWIAHLLCALSPKADFLIILSFVHLWAIPVCVLLGSNIITPLFMEAVGKSLPAWLPNPSLSCGCLHLPQLTLDFFTLIPWEFIISDSHSKKMLPILSPIKRAHIHLKFVHRGTVFPSSSLREMSGCF